MAVFRVEKTRDYTVMSNHHLRNTILSMKAKGLLSLMLSLPDKWDYTLYGLSTLSRDGLSSIRAAVKELEDAGYLRRRRIRNAKGQLIETEYTILEIPKIASVNPKCDFPMLEKPALAKPMEENRTQLNTESTSKEQSNTQSIHLSVGDGIGDIDAIDAYRCMIRDRIGYETLSFKYGQDRIDEISELVLETLVSPQKTFRISSADVPAALVKGRLMQLGQFHIEYVLDCLDQNTTKIKNIKRYLLSSLYNAAVTKESYYQAEVNHDLYGSD